MSNGVQKRYQINIFQKKKTLFKKKSFCHKLKICDK